MILVQLKIKRVWALTHTVNSFPSSSLPKALLSDRTLDVNACEKQERVVGPWTGAAE